MSKAEVQRIRFHYLVKSFHFPNRNALKSFLITQLKREGRKVDAINYIFCNDEYLLQINQSYLHHDTYTDIVTFELSEKGQPLLADIYISISRVKENAFRFNQSFQAELHRVIFHGVLHLVGFTDKTDRDAMGMRASENLWMQRYLVSRDTVSS